MSSHVEALAAILFLATVVFTVSKSAACASGYLTRDFERRRNMWFMITITAFLSYNFWLFTVFTAIVLTFVMRKERSGIAMFLFLLLALPRIPVTIPGMGVLNSLFQLDYIRLLALVVLLPVYLTLRKRPDTDPFGQLTTDKFLAAYLILLFALSLGNRTFPAVLREDLFYPFLDIFLPYYVASRSLRDLPSFRDALTAFGLAAMVLSAVLFFEFFLYWSLYASLDEAWGLSRFGTGYLHRAGNLRAPGSVGHPLGAGFVVAVAFGLFLYLRTLIPDKIRRGLAALLIIGGLIAPISRGPWVGAAACFLIFIALSPMRSSAIMRLAFFGGIVLLILLITGTFENIVEYLPFVGSIEARNVDGRVLLAEAAYQVFLQNPIFGRFDFLEATEMQARRGNDGLIDLVNTYVVVALSAGSVGLFLFVGSFLSVGIQIYKAMRALPDKLSESHLLGRALLSTLVGILLMIATVSPFLVIPTICWCFAGIGVAYARMVSRDEASKSERSYSDSVKKKLT